MPQATKETPLSATEIVRAKQLIQRNGCLSCHRLDDAGSYLGPYLDDVGAHRSPEQLRASLVSPNKEVVAENRTVQLITRDGETVTGRLLNQDAFSVQVIDSSGRLKTYDRQGLRAFTIVTTNPMPSYEEKLDAQDLAGLVRYLGTLKGGGAQ